MIAAPNIVSPAGFGRAFGAAVGAADRPVPVPVCAGQTIKRKPICLHRKI
ncbi:unknown [Alistipes sp. CAG:268]|nr:unknown [Alistipes sp. CAG:268]